MQNIMTVKKYLLLLIIIIFFFSAMEGTSLSQSKLIWHNFNSGFNLAKKNKKNLFIFFFADWCGYCRMMDNVNFVDENIVKSLNNNFISIRLDVDSEKKFLEYNNYHLSPKEFFSLMSGSALPYMVFIDSSGNIITGIPGFIKKEVFIPLLTYIERECYNKNIIFEEYIDGRKSCSKK